MTPFPLPDDTIEAVSREIRQGRRSCTEVLEHCLRSIDQFESWGKAWVVVDRGRALTAARGLDEERRAGRLRGPLHGIPFGIKDIFDVAGLPTAAGFGPWRDRIAERDCDVVALLRAAGAIILGKTVTTQFAWVDPPETANPWRSERTPGGSSSGSAAAVAFRMCLGAVGSQTGGSVIRPASFCGVAGFKSLWPGVGFGTGQGIFPFSPALDHPGLFANSVGDLAIIVQAMQTQLDAREGRAAKSLAAPPNVAPTLYRPRGFFDRRAEPDMASAFEAAIDAIARAGANVIDIPDPLDFERVVRDHRTIMAAQAAAGHEARLKEYAREYAPRIRALVEEGLSVPASEYVRAFDHLESLRARSPEGFPPGVPGVLVTPATIGPAPDRTTTGDPLFNSPFSFTGQPVVSFPFAMHHDQLPLAMQLVGPSVADSTSLLQAARWCETAVRAHFVSR